MLKKYEKEMMLLDLKSEKELLKALKIIYQDASEHTREKLKVLLYDYGQGVGQSKIYQANNQKAILDILEELLKPLQEKQYETIEEYLNESYKTGFIGGLYSLQKQGVPLLIPFDQKKVIAALQTDSKLSVSLYKSLGIDVKKLKKRVAAEISRGIATSDSYTNIARNIDNASKITFNRAMRIARTEGGRIIEAASFETMKAAKAAGADCKKKWIATLDARTRSSHARVDGEIRELDEKFSNGLLHPRDSAGKAEDVINCRCRLVSESKWALEEEETRYLGKTKDMTDEQLKPTAEKLNISVDELRRYSGQIIPVKAKDYEDFRRQYEAIWHYEKVPMTK